jgi:hypothetical protein
MFYHVIFEDCDTRIHEKDDGSWERDPETDFDTFEEARQAAIRYLEELVSDCQKTLGELRKTNAEAYLGDGRKGWGNVLSFVR